MFREWVALWGFDPYTARFAQKFGGDVRDGPFGMPGRRNLL